LLVPSCSGTGATNAGSAGLVAVEAEIADAGRVSVLGSLIGVEDVRDRKDWT
jgi:hypothetical protein